MRITMKQLWSSPAGTRSPGQVVNLPKKVAEKLIAGRYAVAAKSDPVKAAEAKKAARPAEADDDGAGRPAASASKKAWVDWVAAEHGIDHDEADAMTRRELIDLDADGGPDDPAEGEGDGAEGGEE